MNSKFSELKTLNAGFSFSERVLEPMVILERVESKIVASLAGRRHVRGIEKLHYAQGLEFDWVPDGDVIYPLPNDISEHVKDLFRDWDARNLSYPQALSLLKIKNTPFEIRAGTSFLDAANDRASAVQARAFPGLNAQLYPYQERGASWLLDTLEYCGGAILADEMGLGKTLQIISVLLSLNLDVRAPALIVCPTTLLANWSRELAKFAPNLTFALHSGPNRAAIYSDLITTQVRITSYDTLVSDVSLFRSVDWSIIICDEAQAIKNPASLRRRSLVQLPRKFAIPVTGTPVENSLTDLWSLADFAVPGVLGDIEAFSSEYPDSEESAHRLATLTNPLVLKRKVEDVAQDLPERITIDLPIALGEELSQRYDQLRQHVLATYGRVGALVATGQLALFCAHPWLTSDKIGQPDWEDSVELSRIPEISLVTPKLEVTLELLHEAFLRNRKVLIFANFNKCADLIQSAAKALPTAYWNSINGSTPQADRQAIVDEFSDTSGPAVLVLNPKAAGAGLNITAATVVIHYTQVWNPALEAQASARAYRRGQTMPVTIYRLYYEGTVEEVMLARTLWKSELANSAVPISVRDKGDLKAALDISPGGRS